MADHVVILGSLTWLEVQALGSPCPPHRRSTISLANWLEMTESKQAEWVQAVGCPRCQALEGCPAGGITVVAVVHERRGRR